MQKAVNLLPSWLIPAPAPTPAPAETDCRAPPANCFPPKEENLPKQPKKESFRKLTYSKIPWSPGNIGEGDKPAEGRWPCAFFADKPPPAPLWLALADTRFSPAQPIPPRRLLTRASDSMQPPPSTPHRLCTKSTDSTQKYLKARNHRRVQRLLRDMVIELPLAANELAPVGAPSPAPCPFLLGSQTSISTHQSLNTNTKYEAMESSLRPTSASAAGADDFRSIAVQAHTLELANSSKACLECRRRGCGARSEEWVGGVRALRDSHVRLVVRQLRHIELLNRAIDGEGAPPEDDASVSKAASAPPPAS